MGNRYRKGLPSTATGLEESMEMLVKEGDERILRLVIIAELVRSLIFN